MNFIVIFVTLKHAKLVFLLDCLRFSKLLEILPSIWCNFSNLFYASNPGKQVSCVHKLYLCPGLIKQSFSCRAIVAARAIYQSVTIARIPYQSAYAEVRYRA